MAKVQRQVCENCEKRDGVTNSRHWIDYEESDEGHWVCAECEHEFEQDYLSEMEES